MEDKKVYILEFLDDIGDDCTHVCETREAAVRVTREIYEAEMADENGEAIEGRIEFDEYGEDGGELYSIREVPYIAV